MPMKDYTLRLTPEDAEVLLLSMARTMDFHKGGWDEERTVLLDVCLQLTEQKKRQKGN